MCQLVNRYMTLGWSERTFVALGPCVISYVKVPSTVPSEPNVPLKRSVRRFGFTSILTESFGPPSNEREATYRPTRSGEKVGVKVAASVRVAPLPAGTLMNCQR